MAAPLVGSLVGELDDLADVRDALASALVEEPPALARDGGMIRDGVDPDLDALRDISRSGREHIAAMEEAERARTGISSLKIRYNRVFGYYIEISKTNLGTRARRLPPQADDRRRRALHHAGAEGLRGEGARRRREDPRARAGDLRRAPARQVAAAAPRVQESARALATLDVLAALGEVATLHDYTKPLMTDDGEFAVVDARHPVVERAVAASRSSRTTCR